jgi:hypothetical protein
MKQPNRQLKSSPHISYKNEEDELRGALESVQRWWWEYLRLSKDYWWVCKQQGKTLDKELNAMWRDFGDVYRFDFEYWWRHKGRDIFVEQIKLPHVKKLDEYFSNVSPTRENYLIVEIPLNLSERTIARQVLAQIRQHPNRVTETKNQRGRVSNAKRPLAKLVGVRKDILKRAHEIWCVNHLVKLAKQEGSTIGAPFNKMTTHQMGVGFRLVRNCMPKAGDGIIFGKKKRNGMKVAVSRMLARADALIANAEIGRFPSLTKVGLRQRWTEQQQKELDAAVARGEWQPPSVDEANFREMFERMPNLPTSFRLDIGIPA